MPRVRRTGTDEAEIPAQAVWPQSLHVYLSHCEESNGVMVMKVLSEQEALYKLKRLLLFIQVFCCLVFNWDP